ncbi:MAG: OmpA family protein [Firmicutes bacterium]|jgi:chemotaxis protein MotB|nr:OmpA family protein [Bacillota bacterium]
MRRKFREEEDKGGAPSWMTSYADLTQLLLTFFVLLFALSSVDAQKFRQAAISLQGALGVLPAGVGVLEAEDVPALPRPSAPDNHVSGEAAMEIIKGAFQEYLRGQALVGSVQLELTERGLVVSFMDKVLFDVGDTELRPEARNVLKEVAVILDNIPNNIRIEGHTCDLPIQTSRYPSNWELSTGRACAVLRYFIEEAFLEPERFSAMGYGEYRPKVQNIDEASRSLNRRVDVVILKDIEKLVVPDDTGQRMEESPDDETIRNGESS